MLIPRFSLTILRATYSIWKAALSWEPCKTGHQCYVNCNTCEKCKDFASAWEYDAKRFSLSACERTSWLSSKAACPCSQFILIIQIYTAVINLYGFCRENMTYKVFPVLTLDIEWGFNTTNMMRQGWRLRNSASASLFLSAMFFEKSRIELTEVLRFIIVKNS